VWWVPFAAALILAIAGVVGVRGRHARQRALLHLCREAGLEYVPIDPFPDTLWLPFRVFGMGTRRGTENVIWDPRDDPADARAFDHWYVEEGENAAEIGSDGRRRQTCAVVALPFTCPRLDVAPAGTLDPLVGQDVQLELEAFNRRFRVVAEDRRFAVAFLDARMMEALLQLPSGISCAVNEDRMLLWAPRLSAAETIQLLEVARTLRRRVPRVVASLYPPRPATAPHEARWLQGRWSPDPTGIDPST
jgi:hypothetical protein